MRARVGPALSSVMEPDDVIVAGTCARTGPSWLWDVAAALGTFAAGVAVVRLNWPLGQVHGYAAVSATLLTTVIFVAMPLLQLLRKQVFVAVTRRQLIGYRLTLWGYPDRLMFVVPLPTGSVTCKGGSMRYTSPDAKPVQLTTHWYWRRDLGEVAAALQASGTVVEPARRPPAML
jgi:hypothetical protein